MQMATLKGWPCTCRGTERPASTGRSQHRPQAREIDVASRHDCRYPPAADINAPARDRGACRGAGAFRDQVLVFDEAGNRRLEIRLADGDDPIDELPDE